MRRLVAAALLMIAGLGGTLATSSASASIDDDLTMLRQLEPGMWAIRYRDGTPTRRLCARSGLDLLAIRQLAGNCRRSTVESQADRVVVQYSCQRNGYARTSLRRESARLVQIDSQGVDRGTPFATSAEARRIGAC